MAVFGKDDRVALKTLTNDVKFVNPLIHITSKGADGKTRVGTGFMIGPNVVLTAKHVITNTKTFNGNTVTLAPGRDALDYPFGKIPVTSAYHVPTVSINNNGPKENFKHDWMVLNLDRNVGAFTNWLNIEIPSDNNKGDKVELLGYPTRVNNVNYANSPKLFYSPTNTISGENDFLMYSTIDSSPGNSGGPLINFNSLKVNSIAVASSKNENWFLKVTDNMLEGLRLYRTPERTPTDYPDFTSWDNVFETQATESVSSTSGQSFNDKSLPVTIAADKNILSFKGNVYNVGTAPAIKDSRLTIKWYLSRDKIIDKNDYPLGSQSVIPPTPFKNTAFSLDGRFDFKGLESGDYYVGYDIEYSGKEFDRKGYSYSNQSLIEGGKIRILEKEDMNDNTVWRFFRPSNGAHFFTASENEAKYVRKNLSAAYRFEGPAFTGADKTDKGSLEVYRFFNSSTGAHLYTTDTNERDFVIANLKQFSFENVGFYAFESEQPDSSLVHRFYRTDLGSHIYTTDTNEVNYIRNNLSDIYNYEGGKFYALDIDSSNPPLL